MTNVIDIDERAGSFEPVAVKFRGQEYVLGRTALELIAATSVYTENPQADGETQVEFSLRLVPLVLRAVSSEIAAVIDEVPLSAAEEIAFVPILTEVVKRVSALKFR